MLNIIAHRGKGEHSHFENSKEAIISSLKNKNICGVEIDIRITKDNKIIVFHDPVIDFATNGSGIVKFKTYKELKHYKMGSIYKISLLEEILKKINNLKTDKYIIIDIKHENNNYDFLVNKLCKILSEYKKLNIYVCSLNYNLIKEIAKKRINWKIGIIIGFGINKKRMYNHLDFNLVSYNYLDRIDISKKNFIFGVNKKKYLSDIIDKLKSNNIYIITDKPHLFYKSGSFESHI